MMTEEEWLACDEPEGVTAITLNSARVSDRTCRLFAAHAWNQLAVRVPSRQHALEKGIAALAKWAETGRKTKLVRDAQSNGAVLFVEDARRAFLSAAALARPMPDAIRRILRDIFGNPFRPVAFSSEWRTDTAIALARTMYESREFGAMPILADALQDAGCDSDDILNHCRGDGPHVRGCWVCDLVLGKS
jgi:hypothetical protein